MCSEESGDEHNVGVETMKMSEEGCDNKPAREVPEGARECMAAQGRVGLHT